MRNKRKQQMIFAIIGILATIFSIGITITNKVKAASYVRTKATVVQSALNSEYNSNIDPSYIHWMTYSFDVNGKTYTVTRKEMGLSRKVVGDTAYVRYDPNNPEILENIAAEKGGIIATLFFGTFSAILIASMRRN